MKKLLIVNNIPTPYRTFMYNTLYNKGKEYDVDVHVAFQARREARRPWKPEDFNMRFPHFISNGVFKKRSKAKEFFNRSTLNLDILSQIKSGEYDYILMPPSMSVNNWIASVLPAGKSLKLLYSEANRTSLNLDYLPVRIFRRLLYSQFDASICPGHRAFELIGYIAPSMKAKPVIWLPNIIDSSLFITDARTLRNNKEKIRTQLNLPNNQLIIIGVGTVKSKGSHLVLNAAASIPGNYKILFLGDSPQTTELEKQIKNLKLEEKISLTGQKPEDEVVKYLAAADWFIHPALHDPSPLACIEAVSAGLPMAVSKQTGNAPETVEENINGFTFDPTNPQEMKDCLRRILDAPVEECKKMESASRELADKRFDPNKVSSAFFEGILKIKKS
jgi:glycosyltransferase involved in cell wall biosynthesis